MPNILEVKNLDFGYDRGRKILDSLSFAIEEGSYVALAGPNGAGKTTLLKIILGLLKADSGDVYVNGENIDSFSDWSAIGYLPQQLSSFNPMFPASAKEIVSLGLLGSKKYPKRFQSKDREMIRKAMDDLEIWDLADKPIGQLSGGQQQRVFLARALVSSPKLLILDEPSTALDPKSRESFFSLIEKINKERGTTIILITHDVSHIKHHAAKVLYLDRKLMFYGPCSELCQQENGHLHLSHYM